MQHLKVNASGKSVLFGIRKENKHTKLCITVYVLINPVSDYTVIESNTAHFCLQLMRRCIHMTQTSTGDWRFVMVNWHTAWKLWYNTKLSMHNKLVFHQYMYILWSPVHIPCIHALTMYKYPYIVYPNLHSNMATVTAFLLARCDIIWLRLLLLTCTRWAWAWITSSISHYIRGLLVNSIQVFERAEVSSWYERDFLWTTVLSQTCLYVHIHVSKELGIMYLMHYISLYVKRG